MEFEVSTESVRGFQVWAVVVHLEYSFSFGISFDDLMDLSLVSLCPKLQESRKEDLLQRSREFVDV